MTWIWQQADWPNFTWDRSALASLEARFLHESGRRVGVFRHLGDAGRTGMRIRIGRALAEKALAQSLGEPSLIALSRTIARRRRAYDDVLAAAGRSLDITDWLAWFADGETPASHHQLHHAPFRMLAG